MPTGIGSAQKTMENNTSKLFVTLGAALALVFGVFAAAPSQARAFTPEQFIDPGCFFLCSSSGGSGHSGSGSSGGGKVVNNYYNGNYHSPGGTVITGGSTVTTPSSYGYNGGSSYSYNPSGSNTNIAYYNTNYSAPSPSPTYVYNYTNQVPVYTYGSTYSYYGQPTVQQNNYVQPVYVPQQPIYAQPQYSPVYVSCSVSSAYAAVGSSVTWSAYATGGNGYYTYSWSGSDGFYANGQYAYFSYQYPGYKTASVTVYSNGQSYTQQCSSSVNVSAPIVVAQPVPVYPAGYVTSNYSGLDVGCYADPINAGINQPVTWNVEVTGGAGPYAYSWTGTDGLTGTTASVIKFYSSSGAKSAVVTVTTPDGRSAVHACSNSVTVKSNAAPAPKPVVQQPAPVQQPQQQGNGLSANALFSLASIPWGWISILVIILLFGTVLYLIFNKSKI